MILLSGAGGKTGRAILQALVAQGVAVRCLVRRESAARQVTALGASDIVLGSMDDAAMWRPALQGCTAVYHIAPNVDPQEERYATHLLQAAEGRSDLRLLFHSVLHPQIEAMPHHWAKLRVEEKILASGLPFTILRPTAYMQNILPAVAQVRERGVFSVPYPVATRLSLVDLQDVAAAAARVAIDAGHIYGCYDLCGTPPLDQADVAATLARVLDREVTAEEMPLADWENAAERAGLGRAARHTLARMFRTYATQGLPGNTVMLETLLGRPATSLEVMLRRGLGEF